MQQREVAANLCYYVGVTIWTAYGREHVTKVKNVYVLVSNIIHSCCFNGHMCHVYLL